jgi:hypothetical protein
MNKSSLIQLFLGAGLLTLAFYVGIHVNPESKARQADATPDDLASDDLTLKRPMLPRDGSDERTTTEQLPNSGNQADREQLPRGSNEQLSSRQSVKKPDYSSLKFNRREVQASGTLGELHATRPVDVDPGTVTSQPADRYLATTQSRSRSVSGAAGESASPLLPLDNSSRLNIGPMPTQPQETAPQSFMSTQQTKSDTALAPIRGEPIRLESSVRSSFRIHVVRTGESLQTIAERYYQSRDYYLEIYLANQDVLDSPIHLPPGISLKIPDLR